MTDDSVVPTTVKSNDLKRVVSAALSSATRKGFASCTVCFAFACFGCQTNLNDLLSDYLMSLMRLILTIHSKIPSVGLIPTVCFHF